MSSLLVMNCATGGLSTYTGLDWLDVAVADGAVFGVTETAVETLDNAGTEVVVSMIQTGDLDFGTASEVNVPRVYLTLDADGPTTLTTTSSTHGTRISQPYVVPALETADVAHRIVHCARGLRGTSWMFALSGLFDLIRAEVLPVFLLRRGA